MKVYDVVCPLLWAVLAAVLMTTTEGYDPDAESANADEHTNRPRFLKIYSRPHPEAEKQMGVGLKQHFRNVLNGGTIGFHTEFRPLVPIEGFMNNFKKMIPNPHSPGIFGGHGKIFPVNEDKPGIIVPDEGDKPVWKPGKPDVDEPVWKPGKPDVDEPVWKPEKPDEEKIAGKPDRADMELEGPDWEHRDPNKPREDGPKWEDIGEEGDDKVPIEEIIQPRLRPKRFVDSHVYHVPLEFVSNAKPYGVKIRRPNEI